MNEQQCSLLEQALTDGSSDYKEMSKKNGILLRNGAADLHAGDTVVLEEQMKVVVNLKWRLIVGIYDQNLQQVCPLSSGSDFMVVDNTVRKLTGIGQLAGIVTVDYAKKQEDSVRRRIEYLCDQNDEIELFGIEESIKTRSEILTQKHSLYIL